jgi:CheY-like chemotaxis protein
VLDAREVFRNALGICEQDIERKQLRIVIDLAPGPAWVVADPVRLQQVFWNVIRNAVKFTAPGGTITLRSRQPAANAIRFEVCDTGIGFEPEAAPRLFEAFAQGDREITRRFGGLGLGLAISRSIIEAHGGTIVAKSPGPGKGATFSIEFPLRTEGPVPMALPRASTESQRTSLRILLVEDHEDTRLAILRLLRRLGHVVETADCAAAALAQAAAQAFDLVISDLGLPDQGGEEMMMQLRDHHGLRGVAVSGYGMAQDIARAYAAGFTHHLTKPIEFERLRELLMQIRPGDGLVSKRSRAEMSRARKAARPRGSA